MRLLCPFCQRVVEIPDDMAGKPVNCLHCQQAFQAPKLYTAPSGTSTAVAPNGNAPATMNSPAIGGLNPIVTPTVSPAGAPSTVGPGTPTVQVEVSPIVPPPPVMTPSPDASFASLPSHVPPSAPTPPPSPVWHERDTTPAQFRSLSIYPEVLAFIPSVTFSLIFLLSFFSWAGAYPAGYPAYTQNAWRALFASCGKDLVAEDVLKLESTINTVITTDWFMLLYLPLMMFGLVLAWIGPLKGMLQIKLPPVVERFWPYRPALLAVVAIMTLLILTVQWTRSFGIERALTTIATKEFLETKADAKTDEQRQRWEMRVAVAVGGFELQKTTWFKFCWLLHLITGLAVALEAVTTLRGKPTPVRVGVEW